MTRILVAVLFTSSLLTAAELKQDPNTWVKRSPLPDGPTSPCLGYESSLGYDPVAKLVIRWGGHNQGGGGEQNAETWTFDPLTARWTLKEPNLSPPGVCCAQQNVFAPSVGRFVRFPAFSGSHGWHWFRENYLNNTTAWTYDLATNTWRDMRPAPTPRVSPLRCASWDSDCQVIVIFGGEGNQEGTVVYDPFTNTWTRRNPQVQPPFRSAGNMAYDAARKLHILFGSQFTDDPHTWAYDIRKDEWGDLKPAVQPPTNRNAAVLAYDAVNEVVIALVRVVDKQVGNEIVAGHLETWAYDAGKNTWTPMKPPAEPPGHSSRNRLVVAIPDQNAILLENVVRTMEGVSGSVRDQQVWTYRYAEPKADPRPQPPTGLKATTSKEAVTLEWQPSPSPSVSGYVIYRGQARQQIAFEVPIIAGGSSAQPRPIQSNPRPWEVEYQQVGKVEAGQTRFRDEGLKAGGAVYFYIVRSVTSDGRTSGDSLKVRAQPPLVEDVVVSVISPTEVRLNWKAPAPDVVGYYIEQAPVEVFSEDQILRLKKDTPPLAEPSVGAIKAIGKFRPISDLVHETHFTDRGATLGQHFQVGDEPIFTHRFRPDQLDSNGKPYRYGVRAYRVRAVNALGVRSGDSPYFLTIPSSPQWLFSKEDGDDCHLKWAANAEANLKGYRVYRMESPRINGAGQKVTRLTAEPIAEPRYTDPKIGKDTRRYWIVAVDALGQEGFPSAPTWHYRQWRGYYLPFTGEWHQ